MAEQDCKHTLYHRDDAGRLAGTWTADTTPHGPRITCDECGKFYGYEPTHRPHPAAADTTVELRDIEGPKERLGFPSPSSHSAGVAAPHANNEDPSSGLAPSFSPTPDADSKPLSLNGNGQRPIPTDNLAPYDLDRWKAYQARLRAEEVTAAQHIAEFERLFAAKAEFIDHVKRNSNAKSLQLLALQTGRYGARQQTKQENAEAVYRSLLRTFAFDKAVSYSPFSGESYEGAIAKQVQAITDQDIADYLVDQHGKAAATEKSVTNPESLDEFREFVRRRGEQALSDEQHGQFDSLEAHQTRIARKSNAPAEVNQFQTEALQVDDLAITEGYHDKRQCPLYIVKLARRVERATFDELNRKAKMLSGWFSNFKRDQAGFQFLSRDSAEKFIALRDGGVDRTEELNSRHKRKLDAATERLAELAGNLETRAEETIERSNGSLQNTARRADMQASIRDRARNEQAFAETLQSIAAALSRGEAKYLDGVRHMTQVELLQSLLYRAKWNHVHALQKIHAELPPGERGRLLDQVEHREPGPADIRFTKYPFPSVYRRHLEVAVIACKNRSGVKQAAAKMEKRLKADVAEYLEFTHDREIAVFDEFVSRAEGAGYPCPWLARSLDEFKRLKRTNIHTLPELRAALRELLPHLRPPKADDPIAVAERELIGRKIPGFFPTPSPVIERMLELVDIDARHRVLEPSCGKGDIADALQARTPAASLTLVEQNRTFAPILTAKGVNARFMDFLEFHGEFDRILMNPPFEDAQEIDHVRHAFELLAPGGQLVSVMSEGPFFRSDKKSIAFREWLDSIKAFSEPLPDDAFSGREAFRNTSVRTRLIRLERPLELVAAIGDDHTEPTQNREEEPVLPSLPLVRPDRQDTFDGLHHAAWPAPLIDPDSITVDRLHADIDGPPHRFLICRGDAVEVFVDRGELELVIGEVTAIAHARQEVRVSLEEGTEGTWFPVGDVYPAPF